MCLIQLTIEDHPRFYKWQAHQLISDIWLALWYPWFYLSHFRSSGGEWEAVCVNSSNDLKEGRHIEVRDCVRVQFSTVGQL